MTNTNLKSFKAKEIIFKQGEVGDKAYIVDEGQVDVVAEKTDGTQQVLATRGPGTIIGEMALIDRGARTATVIAKTDCQMIEVSQEMISDRLDEADPIIRMVTQIIMARYRDALVRAEIMEPDHNRFSLEQLEQTYSDETTALDTMKLANEFEHALQNNELYLVYQPIVDFNSGLVAGFESLMRWNHPTRGFVSPAEFIPVAEQTGLIVEASKWVLDESCKALQRIRNKMGRDSNLFMSVNFSKADFSAENFLGHMYEILSLNDVNANQIKLEITERLLIDQPEQARETLEMCKKAGMSIAIDDFGTGYSSLSYLHYFPIDTLKIDQSFVRHMKCDENDSLTTLVRSIIALGKNLDMKVVAEGIETVEQAEMVQSEGCDMVQGYFFAKPMEEKDVVPFLQQWKPLKIIEKSA